MWFALAIRLHEQYHPCPTALPVLGNRKHLLKPCTERANQGAMQVLDHLFTINETHRCKCHVCDLVGFCARVVGRDTLRVSPRLNESPWTPVPHVWWNRSQFHLFFPRSRRRSEPIQQEYSKKPPGERDEHVGWKWWPCLTKQTSPDECQPTRGVPGRPVRETIWIPFQSPPASRIQRQGPSCRKTGKG